MGQEDLTEQILAGLTEDYKEKIDAVNGRDAPISYIELHERLINREAMILCIEPSPAALIVAHATTPDLVNIKTRIALPPTIRTTFPTRIRIILPTRVRIRIASQSLTLVVIKLMVHKDIVPNIALNSVWSEALLLLHHGKIKHNNSLGDHPRTSSHGNLVLILLCFLIPLLGWLTQVLRTT